MRHAVAESRTLETIAQELRTLMAEDYKERRRAIERVQAIGALLQEGRDMHNSDKTFSEWVKENGLDEGMLWREKRERTSAMVVAGIPATKLEGCNNTRPDDILKWARKQGIETPSTRRKNPNAKPQKAKANGKTAAAKSAAKAATKRGTGKPALKSIPGGKSRVDDLKAIADTYSLLDAQILVTHFLRRFMTREDTSFLNGPMLVTEHVFSVDMYRDFNPDARSPIDFEGERKAWLEARDPFMLAMLGEKK